MSAYDPEAAAEDLDAALEDGTRAAFMRALRQAAGRHRSTLRILPSSF